MVNVVNKYAALSRSQVIIRLTSIECALMNCKSGSDRDRKLRAERRDLFAALEEKDAALLKKWALT